MRTRAAFLFLVPILLAAALASLFIGGSDLAASDVFRALTHPSEAGAARDIVWSLRMPRVLLALVVGAGLSVSGCVFQGLLRNPLAEPFTLGVSGGAAVGVAAAVIAGSSAPWSLGAGACAGAAVSVLSVSALAHRRDFSRATLLLAGVILNFLCSSLVMFLFSIATSREVHGVLLWLMGDLSSARAGSLVPVALVALLGGGWLLARARAIDLLSLGEERAAQLGLEVGREQRRAFLAASLVAGACVAAAGVIGFVGLVVPHVLRRKTGPVTARLLPAAAVGGAAFLAICDAAARSLAAPLELPVGVVTGLAGGAFALFILLRDRSWRIF